MSLFPDEEKLHTVNIFVMFFLDISSILENEILDLRQRSFVEALEDCRPTSAFLLVVLAPVYGLNCLSVSLLTATRHGKDLDRGFSSRNVSHFFT